MHLLKAILAVQASAVLVQAQFSNTSQQFYLRTEVKPGQSGKAAFNNLWLYAYHTGSATNDAMLSSNISHRTRASLNASDLHSPNGQALSGVLFDFNRPDIPFSMVPDRGANTYAAWQPVGINVGYAAASNYSGFWIDNSGLQWTDAPTGSNAEGFNGWLGKLSRSGPCRARMN